VVLSGWILVYVFEVAFYKTGPSIVYGIYPATAPFFIIGLAAAADRHHDAEAFPA
jgi:hypothetical protein